MVWNNTAASIPPGARIVTEVIPLHSLSPTQVVKDLSSLLPPEAGVVANEGGNAIIMTARQADIRRFTQIIQALDSVGGCELKVFFLDHADAKALAQELKDVFTAQDANAAQGNPFQKLTANRGRGDGGTATARRAVIHVNAVSDDQNNAVLVSAPADIMSGISDLIHKLDIQQDDMVQIRIFGLHHADATDVANQMAAIFPDPTTQASQQNSGRGTGAQFVAGTTATSPGADPATARKSRPPSLPCLTLAPSRSSSPPPKTPCRRLETSLRNWTATRPALCMFMFITLNMPTLRICKARSQTCSDPARNRPPAASSML